MKHDVDVELFYDGVWNSAPAYTRDPIQLGHGRGDEQTQPPPSSCELTVDNRTGDYNPRNITGALYGKIGRNTPVRVTVDGTVRFAGEAAEWAPRRAVDPGDAWVALTCNGPTRRLGQGAKALQSTIRQSILGAAAHPPLAYWPCEDDTRATSLASPVAGVPPMRIVGAVNLASSQEWLASNPVPTLAGGTLRGDVPRPQAGLETIARTFVSVPAAGGTPNVPILSLATTGTGTLWEVFYTAGGGLELFVTRDFVSTSEGGGAFNVNGRPFILSLELTQAGANVTTRILAFFFDEAGEVESILLDDTVVATTVGRVNQVIIGRGGGATGMAVGHVVVGDETTMFAGTAGAITGYAGETAIDRVFRLGDENGLAVDALAGPFTSAELGPQRPDTLLAVLHEAAFTDLGIVTDDPATVGLLYRTRASMYDQAPALELDFTDAGIAPHLEPTIDDQLVRNDITAKRRDGSEAQAVDQGGPLGVDTIGRYDTTVTVNVPGDGFLANQAGWRLHLGTTDEDRWPRLAVDLDAAPELADQVDALRPGDLVAIDGLPPALAGAGRAELLVQGWDELAESHRRLVTFTCTPAAPWLVSEYEAAAGATANKYDTAGSQLAAAVSADTGTLSIATLVKPLWTAADTEDGFYIIIGGEVMQVTDVAGAASPQTFTVVRSTNGVAKLHPAGAAVRLYPTPRYAL